MAKFTDYPVYTYDEPVTYNQFYGGINSDPASENLLDFELRDCLNMHYSSASLVKRKGAKLLCNIECEDELYNIQGVFLFTYRITYIIIAADGKLYQGVYNENTTITLSRLHIRAELVHSADVYDPVNIWEGLDTYYEEQTNVKHDGFLVNYAQEEVRCYDWNGIRLIGYIRSSNVYAKNEYGEVLFKDPETSEPRTSDEMYSLYPEKDISTYVLFPIPSNAKFLTAMVQTSPYRYVGKYEDLDEMLLQIGDVVEWRSLKYILYTTANPNGTFTVRKNSFDDDALWCPIEEYYTKFAKQIEENTDPIATAIKSGETIAGLLSLETIRGEYSFDTSKLPSYEKEKQSWRLGEIAKQYVNTDNGSFEIIKVCIRAHDVFITSPNDSTQWSQITEVEELIFQNYRKIQAATLDNKLYIATGTRFVCVELINNSLVAAPVSPYICNNSEITNLGYNYLSPYPEYCRKTIEDAATTSISNVLTVKQVDGSFELRPMMTFAAGESSSDYYYRWEKKIPDGSEEKWCVIKSFKEAVAAAKFGESFYKITVDDADKFLYRVTFGKSFEEDVSIVDDWACDDTKEYKVGDRVMVGTTLYECLYDHNGADSIAYPDREFRIEIPEIRKPSFALYKKIISANGSITVENLLVDGTVFISSDENEIKAQIDQSTDDVIIYSQPTGGYEIVQSGQLLWKKIYQESAIIRYTDDGIVNDTDLAINEVDGEYFGSASTIIFEKPTGLDDTYTIIQSCTKIVKDNNKLLLYGDNYTSGCWYKTVIDNPAYIGNIGSLSFKTTKNEELVSVVLFNGNIIAFANSENVGGSIHLVTGAGDDYNGDDYYSPYQKRVINTTISCDNADTIQVCENILVFKYFDNLYYISSSDLSSDVVSVYSCNDKLKQKSLDVDIPWDDNSCFSEVTEDYYALCWKEKYSIEDDDLILERPAMRIKMYYKMPYSDNNKYHYPWVRDESEYFNATAVLYVKGKSIFLYNNTLISFNENIYTDLDKSYECKVHFKGVDIGYPKMFKLVQNVLVYYHRNQYSSIDFDLEVRNEAGHILIDSTDKRRSIQDLRALRAGDKMEDGCVRLDSTITDTKVFNASYKFPCLLADATIRATNDKEFSVSSITYNYITIEIPETTPYDLYSSIIRPKEIRND